MQRIIIPMPVSIEQVAAVVRNMSHKERQRLLELVPELRDTSDGPLSPQVGQEQSPVEELRRKILTALDEQLLAPTEPFLDNLTIGDYLNLPDSERSELWNGWEQDSSESWKEVDVGTDALPAR